MDSIRPLPLSKERQKSSSHRCTFAELTAYQELAGSLNLLRHVILPRDAFAAIHVQQAVGRPKVSTLVVENQILFEIKTLAPILTFKSPNALEQPCSLAFYDICEGT